MKQLIGHDQGTYAFNAAAGTVTISGVTLTLEQILLVIDSTTGTVLYAVGQPTLSGTFNAGTGVLTLDYNPAGSANTDHLQIYVDLPAVVQAVSAAALPLPANAAIETGGNLAAIKADVDKIPAQGQALAAASMPVVLPAAQITTLTPPAAITNFANETGGNLAAAKADLDTIAGSVSGGKQKVSASSGDVVVEVVGHAGAVLDGVAGSPSTGVLTAQGVAGGTPLTVELTDGSNLLGTTAHPVVVTQLAQSALGSPAPSTAMIDGFIAATALPAATPNADMVGAMGDKFGRSITYANGPRDIIAPASVQSTSSSNATLIAAIAGVYTDIIHLILTNESATATVVSLTDGTNTYKFALAANGGASIAFPTPLPAAAANHIWQISNSASATVDCVAIYVKNQ